MIHKLTRQEQVNPMELDIVQKGEIPTLLPIQLKSSLRGMSAQATITHERRVIDYLGSGITFGAFLDIIYQIVKTILACQSRGINVNNLEIEDSFLFLNPKQNAVRLVYWPITDVTEDVDLVGFFIRLGSRYYRANAEDQHNQQAYLELFNTRAIFDVQRFESQLRELRKEWREEHQHQRTKPSRQKEREGRLPESLWGLSNQTPYLLRVSTNTRIELRSFPFVMGRGTECNYVMERNNYVSRQHILLLRRNGTIYIQDNGSRNGTMVDERRIPPKQPIPLSSGQVIELGREAFYFFAAGNKS